MSAPVDHGSFRDRLGDPLVVTANLWRGAMIERFARIEFFVDRTLEACAVAGIAARSHASDHFPVKRIEELLEALRDERLGASAGPAATLLEAVKKDWDRRNGLCHGRMRVRPASARLDWTCYRKQERTPQSRTLTWADMLTELTKLDHDQRRLGCLLGSVDRACRDLAPVSPPA
ncbi:hypothetical protein [Tsuneonella amylolytica]|uniref:hypothetical protein n=1 Tax=Tsuneonella amylolytica TaxID=2338327 RepID=UPI0013C3F72C|nr:hypothetical protein [Tsuneonella amylolytica]